ncbi:MAG: dihydrolipoyl dehydrogenase [Alphaproteobacteria bacterium]|nr:dihydrolipoyl dehydrogenase [Alphaproteobacteria bacterium]
MVIGQIATSTDFLVAGGGPGGYVAALRAAQLGRTVTLVDRDGLDGVGGVCLRVGCIPSKGLIEAADLAHRSATDGPAYGLKTKYGGVDMSAFQAWKAELVTGLTDGVRGLLDKAGVRVVEGNLSLSKPDEAVVSTPNGQANFLKFRDLVLATGSRPIELPGFEINGDDILDSTGALNLETLPGAVAIIGGGYIGLEIGIALAKLGSAVTIVEALEGVLPAMDRRIAKPVEKRLGELGVVLHARSKATAFENGELTVETADGAEQIAADKVIVAVGRKPNSDDLGLDLARVSPDNHGLLPVGADRRISNHIAAIGDITSGPALAHKASAEATVAAEALCGRKVAFQPTAIPAVVFSDPEVASAGLTAADANAEGIEVKTTNFPLSASGRARTLNTANGFLQIVSAANGDIVLGVHIVGPHASDLIGEGVLAIEMGATLEDLALSIHPHPTLSEQFLEAAHVGIGQPIHLAVLGKK